MEQVQRFLRPKKYYNNIVEACILIGFLRKILGFSIFTIKSTPGNFIISTFTYVGFAFFTLWHSLYFCALYNVYSNGQTIVRILYDTQLKHYGDLVENIVTTFYVVYAMWKISFDLSGSTKHMQQLVDIDKAIEDLGEKIDHNKTSYPSLLIPIAHFIIWTVRSFTIWVAINTRIGVFPYSKVYQMMFSDSLSFCTAVHYCVYLYIICDRYKRVNKVLKKLQCKGEKLFMVRIKNSDLNTVRSQDRTACEMINKCGKVYSMLYEATETANNKFGLALLLTLFSGLVLIILYSYYFMEATAAGLFHDVERYFKFLMYVFWQIVFTLSMMFSCIYFCEVTVKEAKVTAFFAHTMINTRNIDPSVKEEALTLSMQVIHQTPKFTARGLFPIEYMLLLEGARTVLTFLIILLQSVTQKN